MQFTGHSLPVHQSMSVLLEFFSSSHFISQFPPTRFPLITAIRMCHLLPVHHLGMAFLAGSKGQNITPERKYITCQPSTVAREAVSGDSPHRSETIPTPDTPAPNAHVHTCHFILSVKPAYLKDYIVGLYFHHTYTHINSPLKKSIMTVVW